MELRVACIGGLNGRTLGHKRFYCAQCASNTDIGKLLVPFTEFSHPQHEQYHHNPNMPSLIRKNIFDILYPDQCNRLTEIIEFFHIVV